MKKENKKIAIFLGHPAHFHMLKNVYNNLIKDGYDPMFLIKKKDILEKLVQLCGYSYEVIRDYTRQKTGLIDLMKAVWKTDSATMRLLIKYRPKLLIGSYGPWLSHISGIPIVCVGEDEADVVPKFALLSYPFVRQVVTPTTCDNGRYGEPKSIKYPGYQELGYLHPNHFTPNAQIVEGYGIDTKSPYFILRFSSLNAHHDAGIQGINTEIAQHLVDQLRPHGTIYITSERELEPQFEKYRIKINPLDMHHVMAFASLYIGDSQTMAAEAGVLGTPFIRFNDFVGRIGYLRELEDTYHLGFGIHATPIEMKREDGTLQPSGKEALYAAVEEVLALPADERRKTYQARRAKMLSEKIDYAKFLTWFIENYPQSAKEAKENKDNQEFWKKFK